MAPSSGSAVEVEPSRIERKVASGVGAWIAVATASDGGVQSPGATVPHPRSYGTFPRKIGYYAIQEKLIPVEHAIRTSTGLPADILQLTDRGYIKEGNFADVVVFDPEKYRDTATFDKPHQYATGVKYLVVNGKLAIEDGKHTDVRAGKVLRHNSPAEK